MKNLKIKKYGFIIILAIIVGAVIPLYASSWVAFDPSKPEGSLPVVTSSISNQQNTVVEVNIPGMWISNIYREGLDFDVLEIPGYATTNENGKAAIPIVSKLVAIPAESNVTANIVSIDSTIYSGYHIYPFQGLSWSDEYIFQYDTTFYETCEFYPVTLAETSEPKLWRDCRVVKLTFHPICYNPVTSEIKVYHNLQIQLDYSGISDKNVQTMVRNSISPQIDRAYRELIVNYDYLDFTISRDVQGKYLIITDEYFVTYLEEFIEWKHRKGYPVSIAILDDDVARTDEDIWVYIQNFYFANYEDEIYVLLVGDPEISDLKHLPMHLYTSFWTPVWSDHYYSCLDGDDFFPEVQVGRISPAQANSVDDAAIIESIVQRTISYEINPPIEDTWMKDYTLVAWRNHLDAVGTKDYIADNYLGNYDVTFSKVYGNDEYQGTNEMLKNEIENGTGILNYMGHGGTDMWWQWSFIFENWTVDDALALENGEKRPIIYSHACWPGSIWDESICLCEAFMNAPTGGAIGIFGCTNEEGILISIDFDKGMWKATFPEDFNEERLYVTADIQNYADAYILTLWPVPGTPNYADAYFTTAEAIWLGDPSLEIWTSEPKPILVEIDYFNNFVFVKDGKGDPIDGATVAFIDDNNYEVVISDESGYASASFDFVDIGVTKHDRIPYLAHVLRNNESLSNFDIKENIIIPEGRTLTLSGHINLDYRYQIISEGNLVIQNNSNIYGETTTIPRDETNPEELPGNRIEVYEDITIGNNVQFTANEGEYWDGVYLYDCGTVTMVIPSFENCELHSEDTAVTIIGGSFINSRIEQYREDIIFYYVNFTESFIYANAAGNPFQELAKITIDNCSINNSLFGSAIYISSYSDFEIINNSSINCNGTAINIQESGCGITHLISNNEITGNSNGYGIILYHTYADITGNNNIHGKYSGIVGYHNCEITLVDNEDAPHQEIHNNIFDEVVFNHDSFPIEFHYNRIYDENHNYYLLKCIGHEGFRLHNVTYNDWGPNFDPELDFYPADAFIYDPQWNPRSGEAGDMFALAKQYEEEENYDLAKQTYKNIISIYPESDYSKASAKELFSVESRTDNNFIELQTYYLTEPNMLYDEDMQKLSIALANYCNVKIGYLETAIENYESIVINPPSAQDSVFAVIDVGYTYLLMAGNGREGYVGRIPELKPESRESFEANRDRMLSDLLESDNGLNGNSFIPDIAVLHNNYPNPFNPATTISFSIPKESKVDLSIYNIKGQKVRTLAHSEFEKGYHQIIWNSKDDKGKSTASGIYFYKLKVNGKDKSVRKCLLLK